MQRYRYKHGDRPLEGFTIQRASGSGGFGEVYYALSDGGREVAIKAVQNYEQIELRGITQCMNLKSPHLVTIFDVKHNQHNEPFVIMEYVSGPSLRDLLLESPNGLGVQKSAFFLREIAKGLSYLHECGIVHRDLKPSNIFYENGYVKVGDYGLTKSISASRHSGHTITVGTVHYMAPEIGAGKYNFGIDIYALGVLLFEMLTGQVPFVGGSPGEILMKHMTADPELDEIEEPFAHVIKKALAKDPDERYQSVQEMVEDLFGSENIRNSVSHFSPDELSIVAGHIAAKADIGKKPDSDKPPVGTAVVESTGKQITDTAQRFAQQADDFGRSVADNVDANVDKILGGRKTRIPGVTDPILPEQRRILVFISMIIVALGAGLLRGIDNASVIPQTVLMVFVMTIVCSKVIISSQRHWFANLDTHSRWFSKLATCALASFLAVLLGIMIPELFGLLKNGAEFSHLNQKFNTPFRFFGLGRRAFPDVGAWMSMFLPMLLVNWDRISSPNRAERLSLGTALWIGLLGAIAAGIFGASPVIIAAALAGTSLVVQTACSFDKADQNAHTDQRQTKKKDTQFHRSLATGAVPASMRSGWLAASLGALALGLFLIIYSGVKLGGDDFAFGIAVGVDSLILSIFFFIGSCRSRFNGWYRYLGKPALLLTCILTIVTSAIYMGCVNLHDKEFAIALFLIIFPAVAFFVITFIPARAVAGSVPRTVAPPAPPVFRPPQLAPGVSSFKRFVALLLSSGGLFGIHGLQRFYVGKIGTGILWFFTGGLFLIGQIIDVIMILTGQFKDRYGLPLVVWHDKDELKKDKLAARPAIPVRAPEPKAVVTGRPVQKAQPPRAAQAPKPAPEFRTTSVIYQQFHPLAFLSSGLGFALTVLAVIIGVITGLHLPHFIAAGWLDTSLASQAEEFFGYSQWPELAVRLGSIITVVSLLLAAVFMIMGRRHLGIRHLLRAVLGLGGLFFSIFLFIDGIGGYRFRNIQDSLNSRQIGPAFEKLLDNCTSEEAVFAAFIFLVSVIILAWPPRRKQIVTTSAPNQGASL
ncbi:MAG: protein kinase [Sedimentisphaerales bacterium]|nr:protein kinase [Sedimentisphaerales bacterium]